MNMRFFILGFLLCIMNPAILKDNRFFIEDVDYKEYYSLYNGEKFGDDFKYFVDECLEHNINPNALSRIIEHESGYNIHARNPYTNARGIIQFIPSTARSLGYSSFLISRMNMKEQIDLTIKYLNKVNDIYPIKDSIDLYLAVFYPTTRYTIARAGSVVYQQNKINDIDKDGDIDRYDIGLLMKYDVSNLDTINVSSVIRYVTNDISTREYRIENDNLRYRSIP